MEVWSELGPLCPQWAQLVGAREIWAYWNVGPSDRIMSELTAYMEAMWSSRHWILNQLQGLGSESHPFGSP
jgi:hypothetical protein